MALPLIHLCHFQLTLCQRNSTKGPRINANDDLSRDKKLPTHAKLSCFVLQHHGNIFLYDNDLVHHIWTPTSRQRMKTKSQLVILSNLRFDILKAFHDISMGCHLRHEKKT